MHKHEKNSPSDVLPKEPLLSMGVVKLRRKNDRNQGYHLLLIGV
jgi:hypothetical protein